MGDSIDIYEMKKAINSSIQAGKNERQNEILRRRKIIDDARRTWVTNAELYIKQIPDRMRIAAEKQFEYAQIYLTIQQPFIKRSIYDRMNLDTFTAQYALDPITVYQETTPHQGQYNLPGSTTLKEIPESEEWCPHQIIPIFLEYCEKLELTAKVVRYSDVTTTPKYKFMIVVP